MSQLLLWPLGVTLIFAVCMYLFFSLYSRRLDRQEEAARSRHPAE